MVFCTTGVKCYMRLLMPLNVHLNVLRLVCLEMLFMFTLFILERGGGGLGGGGLGGVRLNVLNFFGILASKKAVVAERFKALTFNPEVPSSSPLPADHGSVYGLLARIPASWVF